MRVRSAYQRFSGINELQEDFFFCHKHRQEMGTRIITARKQKLNFDLSHVLYQMSPRPLMDAF